jgi:hypothetical protein
MEPIAGNMNFVRASVSSPAAAASCARSTARC